MLPAWMIDQVKRRSTSEAATHIGDEYADTRDRPIRDNNSDSGDDDRVLEAGSGGGGQQPAPQVDYAAQNKAAMELEDHRAAIAAEAQAKADQKKADQLVQDKKDYQGRLGTATASARNYGSSRLNQLGITDDYGILPSYETEITRALGTIPDMDPNPGSYLGTSLFENALSGAKTGARNKLTKRYEGEIGDDYENRFISDTADDELINKIISEQYTGANDYITRARDRGQLNDIGYNDAERNLTNARSGAVARANDLGMGVLETGRQGLRDIDKSARAKIADWDFGDQFDPSSYEGRIKSKAGEFTGGLEGRLRNAFGDTQFFDPDSLITKGTKAQGAVNTGASALKDAMTEEERRRTAGSVGAF